MQKSLVKHHSGFSASFFGTSFFATLIVIVLIALLAVIVYRVESALNIDPIVIFTITDHMNGDYSFTFFNFNGSFSLKWLYELKHKLSFTELLIPQSAKMMNNIINDSTDIVTTLINKMVS